MQIAYAKVISITDEDGTEVAQLRHDCDDIYYTVMSTTTPASPEDLRFIAKILESRLVEVMEDNHV